MQVLLFWGSTLYGQQTTCVGSTHIYKVDETENNGNGTTGSTYTWHVEESGFQGVITPLIEFPSGNQVQINWGTTPQGDYTLIVTEFFNNCQNQKEIIVSLRDGIEIDSLEDLLICPEGGNVTFDAGFGYDAYAWYNSNDELLSNSRELTVEEPGIYRLEVRSANCIATEMVEAIPIEFPVFEVNTDAYNTIVVNHSGGNIEELEYQLEDFENNVIKPWQTGNTFYGINQGVYLIRIRTWDASCYTYKTAITVSIPNVITPNADGYNDYWDLSRLGNYAPDATVEVYDRYGKFIQKISSENNFRWDGYYLGRPLPSTSYVYILKIGDEKFTGYLLIQN